MVRPGSRAYTRREHERIRFQADYMRNFQGATTEQVAAALGISRTTLWRIMRGRWDTPKVVSKNGRKHYWRRGRRVAGSK